MAQKPQTLDGKLAIVSGSSKGIGAAIAIELASRGALVVTNYPFASLQQEAESTLEKMRATGGSHVTECFAVESDLSTLSGPKHLVEETVRRTNGRKVDILVNNAGIAKMCFLKDVTVEQWDSQVNLNGRGTFFLTQAVLPHLAKPSRIVNVSSSGARQPYPGASVYNGTKSMIESFTRCWAVELGREYQCTVNAICPGATSTDAFNELTGATRDSLEPMLAMTPAGSRLGETEEMAYAAAFFCEERARWMTGVCLGVNGGTLMA
ncbi:uncharacterized protein A1O5_05804 [Cladophialophora psammophila CBS 110553]|uniref:3-oxoacyl-[acyl-carrier protein] reductase n=1 Tax=Cladophialophora psammophila CBS 110553 TaxID=1182543 RepID=W9XKC5_9EURO|nr:uncharacterized protein A1O5_05804 [Cladophialophora psammophila CBS 110553]EXJ70814.1 hypothetical protein A1O5_05804 [Cladophialophora psammophila CBS 110553]